MIPCRNETDAARLASESYRGLARAAWGLSFAAVNGKIPPVFRELISRSPSLTRKAAMNRIDIDRRRHIITITNQAINGSDGFMSALDASASLIAMRTMDDRMTKFFKKKFNL